MTTLYSKIILFILFSLSLLLTPGVVFAEQIPSASASLIEAEKKVEYVDGRIVTLTKFLKAKKSPLVGESKNFVEYADKYGLDWRMVPAITGVESSFGKRIPYNSYNAYGWNNGDYKFKSWEHSIEHVNKTLRIKYIDKGKTTVAKIARTYAPPSSTWRRNVEFFMHKIEDFPLEYEY